MGDTKGSRRGKDIGMVLALFLLSAMAGFRRALLLVRARTRPKAAAKPSWNQVTSGAWARAEVSSQWLVSSSSFFYPSQLSAAKPSNAGKKSGSGVQNETNEQVTFNHLLLPVPPVPSLVPLPGLMLTLWLQEDIFCYFLCSFSY